jgi:D-glycero-D-manno-heptose 1,7-bisphosphate phosphatase
MNKALFLDRDGVINKEYNYVFRIEDFEFVPGIFELCENYQKKGYLIIVITNQAGIARGYYTEDSFNLLTNWMLGEFNKKGIKISKVYFCPHHPEITGECECRKPKPGMILKAAHDFDIDIENSILIGDKDSDILAGKNAGIKKLYNINEIL